jgi:hypothetical protein
MSQSTAPQTERYRYVDAPSIYSAQTALGEPANVFIVGASGTARKSTDLTSAGTYNAAAIARHNQSSSVGRQIYGNLANFNLHPTQVKTHVNATIHGLDADTFNQLLHNQQPGAVKFAKSLQESIERHANTDELPSNTDHSDRSFQVILETNASAAPLADVRCEPFWPTENGSRKSDVSFAWADKDRHSLGPKAVLFAAPTASRLQGSMVPDDVKSVVNTGNEPWFKRFIEEKCEQTQQVLGTELKRLETEDPRVNPSVMEDAVATAIERVLKAHLMVCTVYDTLATDIEKRAAESQPLIAKSPWRYQEAKQKPVLKAWRRTGA